MLTPSFLHKTLLATACSLSLLACGQKSEAPSDALARLAPVATAPAAAAPLSQMRAKKDRSDASADKMMAEVASPDASLAPASNEPAGGLPAAAIANVPAASDAALKGRKLVLTASARVWRKKHLPVGLGY
jgi:membrane-bound lytic murein transglycosylase B